MATLWSYGNVQITVTDLKEEVSQIIAELQPIDIGTVYQTFGYVNDKYPLQCFVVGSGDASALKAMARDGSSHALTFRGVSVGNFYLEKISVQWVTGYAQTFRLDKSRTDQVYKASLELSKE